jgi:retinol-binding protein 3
MKSRLLFIALAIAAGCGTVRAQVDENHQTKIAAKVGRELIDGYVFPEIGRAVADSLSALASRGGFRTPRAPADFAAFMTATLRGWTHDKHMSVAAPGGGAQGSPGAPLATPRKLIDSVSVLGGIGYLRIGVFAGSTDASDQIMAAMTTLATSDAIIIDVRGCPGGAVTTFLELASYFVPPSTTFGRLYSRQDNSETVFRTTNVRGPEYRSKPVFVLIDSLTFSAAEAFAYHLKHEGRVRIVGDTSGGGAHRVRRVDVGDGFGLALPFTRVINTKTGTDWEGVGVIPDIVTRASVADSAARAEARRSRR